MDRWTKKSRQATIATAIDAGVDALQQGGFGLPDSATTRDMVATVVVATLDTVVDSVPGLLTAHAPSEDAPPLPPGFTGNRGKVIGEARDGAHVVRIVEYVFPDGSRVPYVELHETHDGARPGRVMALSALVHLAQNVTDLEVWAIGNRDQRPAEAPSEGERTQAERWAQAYEGEAQWSERTERERDARIAAMLPLVRAARKPIEDAHAALDVEMPRQVDGRTLSLVERIEGVLRGLEHASNLFDDASDERDAALREIARLRATRATASEDALAALDVAERAYLIAGGWTEVPPQNVMHEPTWTRAGRRYPTHRSQAIAIQRGMDAAVNAGGENGDPK